MKNKGCIPILFVLLLAFLSFSFLTNSNEKLIKNFTLKSVDNKKVSLNDYKDAKGFVVVFISNKCPMAKLYSERLNKINDKYIIKLIEYMTDSEKKLLLTNSFEHIWNYTWCQINQGTFKHTKEYIESKNKFDIIITDSNIKNILSVKNCNNNNESEQEWGFPKGRKKLKEADIDCAVREFCEETQLNKDDIEIDKNIIPFQEIFFGTNNILYKHVYYIAKIINDNAEISLDNNCIEQIREIRSLKWFSEKEVLNHIKNHNIERIKIFKKANSIINYNKSLM